MKVFKFGGASVKDAEGIRNVVTILEKHKKDQLVIVVSAIGKTTNALEKVLNAYYHKSGDVQALFHEVKVFHLSIMQALFEANDPVFAEVNDLLVEIEWILEDEPQESYDYLYDQMVSMGEFLSTKIVSSYLNKSGLATTFFDIRDGIKTDNTYREAKVNWEQTTQDIQRAIPPLLNKGFVMTQGFVGVTSENFTTTLGREGSDFTAAIISCCLQAENMTVWKDVPGILTADPRLFKNVQKIDNLSFGEAIEMTYYGAKVIHPKTIKPLQNKGIPLYVKSFKNPEEEGTLIGNVPPQDYPPVTVIEKNQILLHIATRNFSFIGEENLSAIFALFSKHRIKVNMMQNTAISFSVCTDFKEERITPLIEALNTHYQVTQTTEVELISVRHYRENMLQNLLVNKMVLLNARTPGTAQMVVKEINNLEYRSE